MRFIKLVSLAIVLGLGSAFHATATEGQAAKVSDQKLKSFSRAYESVETIHKSYSASMQAANNKGQAQKLQAQTQEKMQGAIKKRGLSVDEYNDILNKVQTDQKLQERFFQIVGK